MSSIGHLVLEISYASSQFSMFGHVSIPVPGPIYPRIGVESPTSADLIIQNLKSDSLLTFSVVKVYAYSYCKNYTGAVLSYKKIIYITLEKMF